ncbi:MAG: VOC family protein [Nannocystaceae bacterium]
MIGYVTIGTKDLGRAAAFYDALFGELGAKRLMEFPRMIVWGTSFGAPSLGVCTPYDGNEASVGNGVMVALPLPTKDLIDRLHARALELGATDEGAPGPRGDNFYAGYFRDPDGNKFNFFKFGAN